MLENLAHNRDKYLGRERYKEVDKFRRYAWVLGISEKFFKSAGKELALAMKWQWDWVAMVVVAKVEVHGGLREEDGDYNDQNESID